MKDIRDSKLLKKFGGHLRSIRLSKKLTMKEVSFEADIELSQVYRIEKGLINPSLSTLASLAKALDIELKELVDF